MDKNLEFIRQGKTGCVFATILARDPAKANWERIFNPTTLHYNEKSQIVSFVFEDKTKEEGFLGMWNYKINIIETPKDSAVRVETGQYTPFHVNCCKTAGGLVKFKIWGAQ